jgi:mannose-6-phosphate isomerase-like protein (cupin superfamily)
MLNKQTVENRGNFNISVSKVQAISLTVRTSHDVAEMWYVISGDLLLSFYTRNYLREIN